MPNTAFVTGATSGFGQAIARKLAHEGWNVIITGRRRERLQALADELSEYAAILPLAFDVTDKHAVQSAIGGLSGEFAQVTALINNAGMASGAAPAQECSIEGWEAMVDTNIKGPLYCTHALLPTLLAQQAGAAIVNIGSVAANWPYPGSHVYGASKAFIHQFSLNLRCDLVGTGVRVTDVQPGLSKTEFSLVRFAGDRDQADSVYAGTQPILPADVANTVFWVLSQPGNVNVNTIEVMAGCQAWKGFNIVRQEGASPV